MIAAANRTRVLLLVALLAAWIVAVAAVPQAARAAADLTVELVTTPDPAVPGDTLVVAATVRNVGNTPAPDAVVNFTLPTGVSLDSFPGCFNFIIVSCAIGGAVEGSDERQFAAGASQTLTVTLSGLKLGTLEVSVNASHNDVNTDPPPNFATKVVTVEPSADLKLEMAITSPVTIGNNTNLLATVENQLSGTARGTTLQIVIPLETPVAVLPAGCTATALKVTCDLGTIAPQTTVTRSIELAVPTEGTFVLLGSVTWSRPDPTPVDAQGQVTLSGVPPIGPVDPDPAPGDPAAARELPKPQPVSAAFVTTGLPRAGRCLRARILRFKLRRPSGLAITQSDIYIGRQRVKRVTGAALGKTVVLRGLPRKRFTLIVVTTLREGGRLSGRRTFKPCR